MLETAIEHFQRFQAFAVGLIGFAGVITTIAMNGRLARKQHERQLTHERNALRAALRVELETNRRTYVDRSEISSDTKPGQFMLIPEQVTNQVYLRLLDKIGLLTTEEIERLMKAYLLIAEVPTRLKLLAVSSGVELSKYPGYIQIPFEHTQTAARMHASFLPDVTAAVEALKSQSQASRR